jgi:uncharacterized lipoprotein NlpE involved in copper resistance
MTNVGTHIAAVTGIIVVELDRSDIQKKNHSWNLESHTNTISIQILKPTHTFIVKVRTNEGIVMESN